jgi:6-phosphogluconate dehydrogenase
MQIGMIGIGRMGGGMIRRLLEKRHECVVYGRNAAAIGVLVAEGATGTLSLPDFISRLASPRVVWLMLPAASVDSMIEKILPLLSAGDIIVDGGNSHYHDDIRRNAELKQKGISYLDVGTSGGVWGRERGYCLMIGGDAETVKHLDPLFSSLSPGQNAAETTPGRDAFNSTADQGYLHCGPSGAGHFVKMVHNAIEYGLMAAYAEGFNILRHANCGSNTRETDAETTPLRHPEHYQYEFNLADISELWRRGSVVSSWLLDLSARAFGGNSSLDGFSGHVSDSGEGRWAISAAIDEGLPATVLSAALYQRFSSRGESDFADRVLSAMRYQFGGHKEKSPGKGE